MVVLSIVSVLAIAGIGGWEVFLILAAFLLLFGAKKIPELARGLGRGMREFKDATSGLKDEIEKGSSSETPKENL